MTRSESKTDSAKTRIELLKPHIHAGVTHRPGDNLDLDEGTTR